MKGDEHGFSCRREGGGVGKRKDKSHLPFVEVPTLYRAKSSSCVIAPVWAARRSFFFLPPSACVRALPVLLDQLRKGSTCTWTVSSHEITAE